MAVFCWRNSIILGIKKVLGLSKELQDAAKTQPFFIRKSAIAPFVFPPGNEYWREH
ncbi:hypothetical protein EC3431_0794 [Escherichia coli 3431]|nr:hypothetical protein EC3431_0794 [Escherichia coli 3431]